MQAQSARSQTQNCLSVRNQILEVCNFKVNREGIASRHRKQVVLLLFQPDSPRIGSLAEMQKATRARTDNGGFACRANNNQPEPTTENSVRGSSHPNVALRQLSRSKLDAVHSQCVFQNCSARKSKIQSTHTNATIDRNNRLCLLPS